MWRIQHSLCNIPRFYFAFLELTLKLQRVKHNGDINQRLASKCFPWPSLKVPSDESVSSVRTTRRYKPEDCPLHRLRHDNNQSEVIISLDENTLSGCLPNLKTSRLIFVHQFVAVLAFQGRKAKGWSRVSQTHNTGVKILNESTEVTKKIRHKTGRRISTENLVINHENIWWLHVATLQHRWFKHWQTSEKLLLEKQLVSDLILLNVVKISPRPVLWQN
jgi:hypothetical protein